jgi:hypothetical protein
MDDRHWYRSLFAIMTNGIQPDSTFPGRWQLNLVVVALGYTVSAEGTKWLESAISEGAISYSLLY